MVRVTQWRRQDLQFGKAKTECRRREDRGAKDDEKEGNGRGFPLPSRLRGLKSYNLSTS